MNLYLDRKVVVVTGGASGIGAAIVRSCAREGGISVIVDRDAAAVERLQQQLIKDNHRCESVVIDLNETELAMEALRKIGEKLGRIDALVNNAGINDAVGLENGTPELFFSLVCKNLIHYYAMSQAALPFLKESRGSIVNISSKVAVTGQDGTSGYAAAKGAILELTSDWADELAPFGIRVNAVVPAEVWTPQYEDWLRRADDPNREKQLVEQRIPLGNRFTEPDEIASMVLFLVSPPTTITSQVVYVDGGYVHLDRSLT